MSTETHQIVITEDHDSARAPGWYEATCLECGWHTSGGLRVVEDAGAEHQTEAPAIDAKANADANQALREKVAGLAAENESLRTSGFKKMLDLEADITRLNAEVADHKKLANENDYLRTTIAGLLDENQNLRGSIDGPSSQRLIAGALEANTIRRLRAELRDAHALIAAEGSPRRVFRLDLPDGPGSTVRQVTDRNGETWRRRGSVWANAHGGALAWPNLLWHHGPVTDTTEEGR